MRQITTFVIAAVVIGVSMFAVAGGAAGQGAYSDEAIQAAIDIGARDKVQDIRPSCTAEVGGFWNKLSENLAASEGWGGGAQVQHRRLVPTIAGGMDRTGREAEVHAHAAAERRSHRGDAGG